jgi:hypothetical protein
MTRHPFREIIRRGRAGLGLGCLEERGNWWVVGSFQKASKDDHNLFECLADSKLRARGVAWGV